MKHGLALAIPLMASLTPALAQPEPGIVRAFLETCVQTLPNTDRVRTLAQSQNWTSVDGDMGIVLGPPLASNAQRIWFVKQPAIAFFVGIGKGTLGGTRTSACSVADPQATSDSVLPSLSETMHLQMPLSDRRTGGERMRVWTNILHGKTGYVLLADAGPAPGVTLTVIAPAR